MWHWEIRSRNEWILWKAVLRRFPPLKMADHILLLDRPCKSPCELPPSTGSQFIRAPAASVVPQLRVTLSSHLQSETFSFFARQISTLKDGFRSLVHDRYISFSFFETRLRISLKEYVRPSVRPSVGPYLARFLRPSICPFICPSILMFLLKITSVS